MVGGMSLVITQEDFLVKFVLAQLPTGKPSGGSRIFQRGASTYYLVKFSRKLHENEEILDRGRLLRP